MTNFKFLFAMSGAAALLAIGGPALATTAGPAAKPAAAKPHPALVAAKPKPAAPRMIAARPAASGRMVRAKLGNGKVVTYNCSLAGNQTKQVCKR